MTTATIDLERRPWPLAADVIKDVGWVQHAMDTDEGVCLTGAIRRCSPQPGDWAIYTEVARHREHAEGWNDQPGRTKRQVTTWLRRTAEITDAELLAVFGPQWEAIVALVRRAVMLTPKERTAYWNAIEKAWKSKPYLQARRAVIVCGGPGGAARQALVAFVDYGYGAGVGAALARRHEIGTAFTQQQYDLVVKPWVDLFGPVHPEDVAA